MAYLVECVDGTLGLVVVVDVEVGGEGAQLAVGVPDVGLGVGLEEACPLNDGALSPLSAPVDAEGGSGAEGHAPSDSVSWYHSRPRRSWHMQ